MDLNGSLLPRNAASDRTQKTGVVPADPVSISRLVKCRSWKDVTNLLRGAQKQRALGRDAADARDARFLVEDFRLILGMFCPRHDFKRDSVQERALIHFGSPARGFFLKQEDARLFSGFKLACEFAFGGGWRHTHPEALRGLLLLEQLDSLSQAPEVLGDNSEVLQSALARGDSAFFEQIAKRLRQGSPQHDGRDSIEAGRSAIPQLDPKAEFCRHWTNPDFPLWLMMDPALKQALRYLTNGAFVADRSLQQRIHRMGLRRHARRPVQEMIVQRDDKTGRLRFEGYGFAEYIRAAMKDLPTSLGYGETGNWKAGAVP